MVLPLRFPPGMAGGLLLAYPRTRYAWALLDVMCDLPRDALKDYCIRE